MKQIHELLDEYIKRANVAHYVGSGAEEKALYRIVMALTTPDPVQQLLLSKQQAELDIREKPDLAAKYNRKIKWYDQAIAELLGE